jgi:hypothetical protein
MRLSSTHQQRRFRDSKHKCYKDDEDYPLLVIKPTKYLDVLAQGWIVKDYQVLITFIKIFTKASSSYCQMVAGCSR